MTAEVINLAEVAYQRFREEKLKHTPDDNKIFGVIKPVFYAGFMEGVIVSRCAVVSAFDELRDNAPPFFDMNEMLQKVLPDDPDFLEKKRQELIDELSTCSLEKGRTLAAILGEVDAALERLRGAGL